MAIVAWEVELGLLDMSAALVCVDHFILLQRLERRALLQNSLLPPFGIVFCGQADFAWYYETPYGLHVDCGTAPFCRCRCQLQFTKPSQQPTKFYVLLLVFMMGRHRRNYILTYYFYHIWCDRSHFVGHKVAFWHTRMIFRHLRYNWYSCYVWYNSNNWYSNTSNIGFTP